MDSCPRCGYKSKRGPVRACRCGWSQNDPDPTPLSTIGSDLMARRPELFSEACGCRDAARLMDHWGPERSRAEINRLVRMLVSGLVTSGRSVAWELSINDIHDAVLEACDQ